MSITSSLPLIPQNERRGLSIHDIATSRLLYVDMLQLLPRHLRVGPETIRCVLVVVVIYICNNNVLDEVINNVWTIITFEKQIWSGMVLNLA